VRLGSGKHPSLSRNVYVLAVVALCNDVATEMIYPLIPAFLTMVLGASPGFIGVIEGTAETTAALLKLASGWWSDRVAKRKPLVVFGYALASVVRPLVGLAQSASQVLLIRVSDRVGKGVRNAPRDALMADSVDPAVRGRAYGFERAADNLGAFIGPVLAFAAMQWGHVSVRAVFWLAAIPGAVTVATAMIGIREVPRRAPTKAGGPDLSQPMGSRFWAVIAVIFVFTLGNSTDAFLLLRAHELGVAVVLAPILWAVLNLSKAASNTPGGALSDRIGRARTLVFGWALYAAIYWAFGRAGASWEAWGLFALYGLYFGLTEGAERALIADLVPKDRRGTAFGWYYLAIGVGALPASLLFGVLWDRVGSRAAFDVGAALAFVAAVGMAFLPLGRVQRDAQSDVGAS